MIIDHAIQPDVFVKRRFVSLLMSGMAKKYG
jgi:hypothetical protein